MIVRIQYDKIDLSDLIEATRNPESGAIVTFQGTVRRFSDDIEVSSLHYEAYKEMAIRRIKEIVSDAVDKFGVNDINVVHRIGDLGITEDSVAISVSSAHRADAFNACHYVIDAIKKDVPIWKQDIMEKGTKRWH